MVLLMIKNFDYDDVTLIEWPFKYWNPNKGTTQHHAQPPQLQHSYIVLVKHIVNI